MDEKCSPIWQKLSLALKPEVGADSFKRWFSSVELIQSTDEALTFRVPNNIYQLWIESNYMTALQGAVMAALGSPREIKFSAAGTAGAIPSDTAVLDVATAVTTEPNRDQKSNNSAAGLNPRNTFESFVVGPNNEI